MENNILDYLIIHKGVIDDTFDQPDDWIYGNRKEEELKSYFKSISANQFIDAISLLVQEQSLRIFSLFNSLDGSRSKNTMQNWDEYIISNVANPQVNRIVFQINKMGKIIECDIEFKNFISYNNQQVRRIVLKSPIGEKNK